ncbi:TetR/AcrR family transcriptional regulator [Amnibacterium kyonggiense]|uniref:TetR family transcriptional regulator n=1 Tax=Amnibacterium kyonggiense TaxID=595671 RepID=A0A4R7FFP9_9MICO|nr:TetR/AcrR family transcriptional regulator [Amnibacterium kyonggiense]TDS75041.1 TetR family transcriptional regulator [Amnibacterium kyonggiense]
MTIAAERGYAKGRAKRAEIIERATALFGEVGYRGASLREIASRCGISHPGLLHHFATKEALLIAVLEHRDEQDIAQFFTPPVRGVAQLRRVVELARRNEGRRGIVELYTVLSAEATAADHPAHAYFVRRYRASRAEMRESYEQAREDGALRDGVDPDVAARELVAVMDGLQVQWLLDGCTSDMADLVRQHVQERLTVPL